MELSQLEPTAVIAASVAAALCVRRLAFGSTYSTAAERRARLRGTPFERVSAAAARLCLAARTAQSGCSTFALPRAAVRSACLRTTPAEVETILQRLASNVKWGPFTVTSG